MPLQEGEVKRIMKRREPDREEGEPCLECKATVLNINAGRNNDMMRKCRRLSDYAYFIGQIRWKMDEGWSLEEATEISIKRCIDRGILADILTKHGMEVCRMILTEYDEQEEREYQRAEGRAEGRACQRRCDPCTNFHKPELICVCDDCDFKRTASSRPGNGPGPEKRGCSVSVTAARAGAVRRGGYS